MRLDNPKTLLLPVALPTMLAATLLASCPHRLLAQTGGSGQAAAPAVTAPLQGVATVNVNSTQIAEIDKTHVRIAVDLSVVPARTITLENVRLTGLRMNGLPVYAQPLAEPIELVKGKETALPPLYITLQLRDLTTTKPLREMVENQSVHLSGEMVAGIKMSFLDKLATHTLHPRLGLPVVQDVPVSFGSSPIARQAALGVLTLVDLGMASSAEAKKVIPGLESPWIKSLQEEAKADLITVETSFVLKQHEGAFPVVFDQLGFRLGPGLVVTTAESKAPWEYDADFLARIKSGEAKLEKKSFEIQLRPTGAPDDAPMLLTHKDFTFEDRGKSGKDPLFVANPNPAPSEGGIAKISVHRRADPNALLVMVLKAPPAAGGFPAAPAAILRQDTWEKVAIYRLNIDPTTGKPSVEVVQLPAHRDGEAIHLDESVDPTFFGSPILTPEGVIGIVQDEQIGAFLPANLTSGS